ncbi:Trm112 family protein [Streptomyces sp. TRM 70351]|uniref:Trm112 family protein n=1 Tax=Streptomyces sp. TRM 70351 TaxID=3116552 RepID=UPI002E7B3B7F|nr:Trm112 family protein [Streptomyces sp. TRM 70351]MEE1929312.1 Trm112 family protein [Streptomyces sp. TRM 70351]
MPLEAGLLEILACPACHAPLREEAAPQAPEETGTDTAPDGELVCAGDACGLAYPVRDGIPVLLVDEARRPG